MKQKSMHVVAYFLYSIGNEESVSHCKNNSYLTCMGQPISIGKATIIDNISGGYIFGIRIIGAIIITIVITAVPIMPRVRAYLILVIMIFFV